MTCSRNDSGRPGAWTLITIMDILAASCHCQLRALLLMASQFPTVTPLFLQFHLLTLWLPLVTPFLLLAPFFLLTLSCLLALALLSASKVQLPRPPKLERHLPMLSYLLAETLQL